MDGPRQAEWLRANLGKLIDFTMARAQAELDPIVNSLIKEDVTDTADADTLTAICLFGARPLVLSGYGVGQDWMRQMLHFTASFYRFLHFRDHVFVFAALDVHVNLACMSSVEVSPLNIRSLPLDRQVIDLVNATRAGDIHAIWRWDVSESFRDALPDIVDLILSYLGVRKK